VSRRSLKELYLAAQADAEAAHAEYRKLVFGFDDLAKRLLGYPMGYREPRQWSGYIPPLMVEGAQGARSMVRNPSPQRVHLVAIVREAYARTYGEQVAQTWLTEINTDQWSGPWTPHTAAEGN
jgi:hypothetical protein